MVQMSNALKQFREQNINVALLNSGEVNSGMKLHVNYVVLLDPVILHYWRYKKEDERACEIRALGLAHHQKVALVRFVIQESIEEKLFVQYKSALEGGKQGQLNWSKLLLIFVLKEAMKIAKFKR